MERPRFTILRKALARSQKRQFLPFGMVSPSTLLARINRYLHYHSALVL
jgi:hypothetical protein